MYQYLSDKKISEALLEEMAQTKRSLKIATSNMKSLKINERSFIDILEEMVCRGVKVQILCMHQSQSVVDEIRNRPALSASKKLFKVKVCPRNHMKMFAFDWKKVYIGSANLTNAAMGSRRVTRMNYENGIITDDEHVAVSAIGHFDKVWIASACEGCESKLCSKNL